MAEASDLQRIVSAGPKRGRYRSKHERLILTSTWTHNERELVAAMDHVRKSGVLGPLETAMEMPHDPESRLSVFGYLVTLTLNGSTLHHKATLVETVRLLNGFGPGALDPLGMRGWRRVGAYDHVHRFHKRLAGLLDAAPEVLDAPSGEFVTCDWAWFQHRLLLAAIPDEVMVTMVGNTDLALDGTEMESCGQLTGDPTTIEYDGEAPPPDDAEQKKAKNAKKKAKAKSFRLALTDATCTRKDADARGGYRTGNANHPGGTYVGRELHLGIAVKTVKHTDGVSYVNFGPEVPPVIVTARPVPAGSHRGDPAVEMTAIAAGLCNCVNVDRGYIQSVTERFHFPLQALGLHVFSRLKENQRGEKPGIGPAHHIDGHSSPTFPTSS